MQTGVKNSAEKTQKVPLYQIIVVESLVDKMPDICFN